LENELGFEEVCYAELEAMVETEVVEDGRKDVGVMSVEFDLAGEVDEEVVIVVSAELFV
jgi:hypothetical protein